MSSSVHRFLSRRERKPKVNPPRPPFLLSSLSFPLLPSFLAHSKAARRHSVPDTCEGAGGHGHARRGSASPSGTLFDLSLSLDGAGSIGRPRRRPASVHVAPPTAPATTADCDLGLNLQVAPDIGAFGGLFIPNGQKKPDKDEEKRIKAVLAQLQKYGITNFTEANVDYALRATAPTSSTDEALRLLLLFEDTYEGIVKVYNPQTKLLGAENRSGVTCYLDALLFAMFARLDSFEAMLYNSFEDLPRKKLAGLLRLWVNMLRSGKLITTDITKHLQDALAETGWDSAAKLNQQDTSEAFTFITGQLELPLLTLKMDLFHTGKEDPTDDHKFINERLLEVAILTEPPEGSSVITLEDCLENYFNNRIEVKRHLERHRSNTMRSTASNDRPPPFSEKSTAMHVETVEIAEPVQVSEESPVTESPTTDSPATPVKSPLDRIRPGPRKRADSIFSQRRVQASGDEKKDLDDTVSLASSKQRKASIRTEVLMPAWQFFKLLPWYTDNMPTSDAQVAAHFSRKRPVLGIALKRYQVSNTGVASRLNTFIDIPLEIAVPNFLSDDSMEDGGPLVGNFKLVLQSVVCHRGTSVNSGHYISLVRGQASNADHRDSSDRPESVSSDEDADPWMLFDDLARERVTFVDIAQKLKEECPYLLFYQVQPIDEDLFLGDPPSYESHTFSGRADDAESPEKLDKIPSNDVDAPPKNYESPPLADDKFQTDAVDWSTSTRTSIDINVAPDNAIRGRRSMSRSRRSSIAIESAGSSLPTTPNLTLDESRTGWLGLPTSRRGSQFGGRKSKSRPGSQGAEGSSRFSLNMSMSKLTGRGSRTDLLALAAAAEEEEKALEKEKDKGALSDGEKEKQKITLGSVSGGEASAESLKPIGGPELIKEPPATKGKIRKGKGHEHHHHHHHHHRRKKGEEPDRECIVM
ncbi:hypothetical protein MBLNU459_g3053t1 [Dothideomycetes sp. NU459]